jgi:hypothetical protein
MRELAVEAVDGHDERQARSRPGSGHPT